MKQNISQFRTQAPRRAGLKISPRVLTSNKILIPRSTCSVGKGRLTSSVRQNRLLRSINKIDRAVHEGKGKKKICRWSKKLSTNRCATFYQNSSFSVTKNFPNFCVSTAISHNAIDFAGRQEQSSEKNSNRLLLAAPSESPNAGSAHPRLFWYHDETKGRW